jgi:ribosomal protein S27E
VVQRSAPERKHDHFPCSGCGAALEFAPGQTALKCPYCGNSQQIPTTREEVRELAYKDYFNSARLIPEVMAGTALEVKCPKCAAVSSIPASIAADRCSFCGTPVENAHPSTTRMMRPQGVLPFRVEDKAARELFSAWVASRWFAPNDLKKMASLGRIDGMYVPFWTYDTYTVTFYTGLRGDHYYVTVRDSKGNSRREQRTRWTPASGRVNHWFDDVLVCASQGLPDKLVHALEPWELHHVKDYQPELIAGFRVERYQVDAEQGFDRAKDFMKPTIEMLIRRDIGGDVQTITTMDTQYDGITFKHLLLPVWVSAYQYHQKTYRVLVNAQTGEVQGERPWSWIKITLAVLAALIVVAVVVYYGDMLDSVSVEF